MAQVADQWIDDKNPNVSSDQPQNDLWWQTFNDPVLNDLIKIAYQQNLSLRVACWRVIEARAQRGIAIGELFPQTQQVSGDYTRTNASKNAPGTGNLLNYDEWRLGTNLAWELDFWGRFRRAVESADASLDASIENYDDVLVLLLAEVAQSYVELRTAEKRLEYAQKNVDDQRKSLRLAEIKFQNGATTKLDVTQGESNLAQTEATMPPLLATKRQAANQLCILMGMPPRNIEEMLGKHSIPSASPKVIVGIPADLVRRRPDIRRAEREAAAQSAQIGVATAALYPHFSIAGTIYFDAQNFQDILGSDSLGGNIGPSFNWNVLNYGRLANNIRVQDAMFQQLAYKYQNTVLKANAEVENSLVGFLQAQRQVKFLNTSVEAAVQSLDLVRSQYNEGKTDFNRVLSVEQLLTQQEDQLAVALGSVAKNLVSVYKSIGGGWQIRLDGEASPTETDISGGNAEGQPEPPAPPEKVKLEQPAPPAP